MHLFVRRVSVCRRAGQDGTQQGGRAAQGDRRDETDGADGGAAAAAVALHRLQRVLCKSSHGIVTKSGGGELFGAFQEEKHVRQVGT